MFKLRLSVSCEEQIKLAQMVSTAKDVTARHVNLVIDANFEQMLQFLILTPLPNLCFVCYLTAVVWCSPFCERYLLVGKLCYHSEVGYMAPRGGPGMVSLLIVSPSDSESKSGSCAVTDYPDEDDGVMVQGERTVSNSISRPTTFR
jgi:hypothetical protein